jgi:predicted alpha/beta-hydrolase family hydrolase
VSLETGKPVQITVDADHTVSALYVAPRAAAACYIFAHGAGAGMNHPFMLEIANGLASRKIATLRYQFPYMEAGSKRPDRPDLAQATVLAAVRTATELAPRKTLIAGGKSFGGRMTSQAQAAAPLPKVRGLAFVGFPLHPANKPSATRADHLARIDIPMLFIQGDRDALADRKLLLPVVRGLGRRAVLQTIKGADHAFHVLARSGRTDEQALDELLDGLAGWIMGVVDGDR